MKIVRYRSAQDQIEFGMMHSDGVERLDGELFGELRPTGECAAVAKLLAPLVPTSMFCVGLNYQHHAEESGAKVPEFPILFFKAINSLQNPGDPIEIPTRLASETVDYEGELAVVIGRTCKNVSREEALDYVLGYTCANDVSARDWQLKKGGGQWGRGKTFDTFCPLGPCLATPEEIANPNTLRLRTMVNGETVQDWNTSDMIFDVPALIEFFSASTTLLPGTVILTGTPHGVGMAAAPPRWLKPGDIVSVDLEGIGTLTNPVRAEDS